MFSQTKENEGSLRRNEVEEKGKKTPYHENYTCSSALFCAIYLQHKYCQCDKNFETKNSDIFVETDCNFLKNSFKNRDAQIHN